MNTINIKVGQVWEIKEESKRHWFENIVTITFVGSDYFVYKEDPNQKSWHFSLLTDNYDLVSEKE